MKCDISICNSLCCRNCPVLTEHEVAELISGVKKEYGLELDLKKYFRPAKGEHGTYYAVRMIKGHCIFLNREKRCLIYTCRPTLCRLYPVIDVDAVDDRCPNRLPENVLEKLKQRYADEIDVGIKEEETFWFV